MVHHDFTPCPFGALAVISWCCFSPCLPIFSFSPQLLLPQLHVCLVCPSHSSLDLLLRTKCFLYFSSARTTVRHLRPLLYSPRCISPYPWLHSLSTVCGNDCFQSNGCSFCHREQKDELSYSSSSVIFQRC